VAGLGFPRVGEAGKPFPKGCSRQARIQGDKGKVLGLAPAGHPGCGQLKGIPGSQGVGEEEAAV